MTQISENLQAIRLRIADACLRAQRAPSEVRLIAVSKVKPGALVAEAFAAGQELFGESYVQEFRDKCREVAQPVTWHFIGGLQTNKVKYLCGQVAMIHSVDRLSLAEAIDRQWGKSGSVADILIQVNVGEEDTKSGVSASDLETLIRQVAVLPHVHICGLMTLPPYCSDPEEVRPFFKRMRVLADQIRALGLDRVDMTELSMGMSHDFEVAIEEGATLVRVGTAIFGERERR